MKWKLCLYRGYIGDTYWGYIGIMDKKFFEGGRLVLWDAGVEQRIPRALYQDPPCTLNWGYMVPNSGYLGPY